MLHFLFFSGGLISFQTKIERGENDTEMTLKFLLTSTRKAEGHKSRHLGPSKCSTAVKMDALAQARFSRNTRKKLLWQWTIFFF